MVNSRHYTRHWSPRSASVWQDSLTHAICSQLAYSFHNRCKSQEFFSLPLQRISQCSYSHIQVSSEYTQPRRPNPGMLLQRTQRKGLKGHSKSTINTFQRFPAFPSQTKEWEEIQWSLKELTVCSLYQQKKKKRIAKSPTDDSEPPDNPALLSSSPSGRGGVERPVWGLNGMAETKSRAVIHLFLKIP